MKKYILAYVDPSSGLSLGSHDNERDFTSAYLYQRIGIEPSSKAKEDLEQCEFPEQAEALRLFHEGRYQDAIDAASELDPTDYDYPEIATEEIDIPDGPRLCEPQQPAIPKVIFVLDGGCIDHVASDRPVQVITCDIDRGSSQSVYVRDRSPDGGPADYEATAADVLKKLTDAVTEARGEYEAYDEAQMLAAVDQQSLDPICENPRPSAVPSISPLDNPERFAEWLAAHHIIDESAVHDAEHYDGGITMNKITNALSSLKSEN